MRPFSRAVPDSRDEHRCGRRGRWVRLQPLRYERPERALVAVPQPDGFADASWGTPTRVLAKCSGSVRLPCANSCTNAPTSPEMAMATKQSFQVWPTASSPRATRSGPSASKTLVTKAFPWGVIVAVLRDTVMETSAHHRRTSRKLLSAPSASVARLVPAVSDSGWRRRGRQSEGSAAGLPGSGYASHDG